MTNPRSDALLEPGKVVGWQAAMDAIAEDDGYLEPLGQHHWAFFAETSPTLLVTFETADSIKARKDTLPLGYTVAQAKGWSHLCLISDGDTWYRDRAVYGYFDRLVDDAFFEDFDRVVFYGAGMGGYAAAAFCVTAPGAAVVAVCPRATLDPARAGWDTRHTKSRRLCFTDRYGYAPDMTEGTGHLWLIHDPLESEDAMHASLFAKPHVTILRARYAGARIDVVLEATDMLAPVLEAAAQNTLTTISFAKLWRARRAYGPYLRGIVQRAQDAGRTGLELHALRSITSRMHAPRLARRLAALSGDAAKP